MEGLGRFSMLSMQLSLLLCMPISARRRQEPTATYIVGFGNKYPERVHHRGATIPYDGVKYGCKGGTEWKQSKKANPNIILGVTVAGPDRHDGFKGVRDDCNYTEPSLAANVGLVAALTSLPE